MKNNSIAISITSLATVLAAISAYAALSEEELAKLAQNPIGNLTDLVADHHRQLEGR